MKKYLFLFALLWVGTVHAHAQLLTGFGTAQFNPFEAGNPNIDPNSDFVAPWNTGTGGINVATLTSMDLTVSSVSNQQGGIQSLLGAPVSISLANQAYLSLTGALTLAPATNNFTIKLYDTTFSNALIYDFQWSSFNSTSTTVNAMLAGTQGGVFNGTVGGWELDVAGSPGETVSFVFQNLISSATPVPEPSTWFLLAIGALLLGGVYPRKVRQS